MRIDFEKLAGFEWDQGNIDNNRIKHNVENWECEQIFFNDPLIILDDPKPSIAEKRFAAFGRTNTGRFLVIIFIIRGKLIRVISAREMKRKELL